MATYTRSLADLAGSMTEQTQPPRPYETFGGADGICMRVDRFYELMDLEEHAAGVHEYGHATCHL